MHHLTMANSLDLDPEWGAIDLLEEVEATFGIKFADEETQRCETVGQLYDLLCAHLSKWDYQEGKCGSAMVFYMFRRSLAPKSRRSFGPDTPLAACGQQPNALFKKLAHDTRLRLPANQATWPGIAGGALMLGCIVSAGPALLAGHWIVSGALALVAVAGLLLMRLDPGRFPAGVTSVSDLVRRVTPLNVKRLRDAGGRPANRWAVLVALAAEHGFLSPDEIGPETFFHRQSLEQASSR